MTISAIPVFSQNAEQTIPPYNLFSMPALQQAHMGFAGKFKSALAKQDYKTMEEICVTAVKWFPEDPTWRYNLACSYARRGNPHDALEALQRAVQLGFTDEKHIAEDSDLATLRRDRKFASILEEAKYYRENPDKLKNRVTPTLVGKTAQISKSNTTWNMESGGFITLFKFPEYEKPETNRYVKVPGQTGEKIREWQKEGTAAGNFGDLYDNIDGFHSTLDLKLFPEMIPTRYCAEAISNRLHKTGATMFNFGGIPVIGNCSMAMTQGPYWRSIARHAQGSTIQFLLSQYLNNQLYVYPQHHDYLPTIAGDVFPTRTPYLYLSPGSSWTDQPILAALVSAAAAMRPETKQLIVRRHMLAPVLQYLIHSSLKSVTKREDYLTPSAQPFVLNGSSIDTLKLVELAHSITTNALPPVTALRLVKEEGAGSTPFADYFDWAQGERLLDSPFAIGRVFRGMNYTRKYVLEAMPVNPVIGEKLNFHWFMIQGNADHVRITQIGTDNHRAEIEIDYHGPDFDTPFGVRSSRVDIALVSDNGTHYSPAAIFTCLFLNNEVRTYSDDKRILSVDYVSRAEKYVDPYVSLRKDWRDLYTYDDKNNVKGWTRIREGKDPVAYAANGERIVKIGKDGTPEQTVKPSYSVLEVESPDGPVPVLKEE